MATIVTRAAKGSPLTNTELDANFTNLNDAVVGAVRVATVQVTDGSGAITAGPGKAYFRVPSDLAGMDLIDCGFAVTAPSTSGTLDIMLSRGRQSGPTGGGRSDPH